MSEARFHPSFEYFYARLSDRSAVAGVIGLGYIGLPLTMAIARAGFKVIGFDVDPSKPRRLNEGQSYIASGPGEELLSSVDRGVFIATSQFDRLKECDGVVICVPTPTTRYREPDPSYIESSARQICKSLRRGQLVVLESTTYPGTTREIVQPILDASGLTLGEDYFLGYSLEREDPGNPTFITAAISKIIAGLDDNASKLLHAFYGAVVTQTVPVSSTDVAEAVKLTENIFRAVNIALVNELKNVFAGMGIDIWEVIEAAKTKPFGYMPFHPGPGPGGHCIPIGLFDLTWKARECGLSARFIELAGEVKRGDPRLRG